MRKNKKIIFKKNVNIGAPDAEQDDVFLSECFVNTGDIESLRDTVDNKRIILGRTGSGKTALLNRLMEIEDNTIIIPPETLSLSYLSNSSVLQFFTEIGVNLDIFYRLLWRHVFTVELIRHKFNIKDENSKKSFFEMIKDWLTTDKKKKDAIEYLTQWGESFWAETEYRIREVTSTLENDLEASIKGSLPFSEINLTGAKKLTEEQKADVIHRGQAVVNQVQIKKLSSVFDLLSDNIFDDPQQRYYIIIDKLDEEWVEDKLRYKLIRALIETIKAFKKVKNVKILVALRTDLLERVFRLTRSPGFQEEKYEALFLYLSWSKENLIHIIDTRINYLLKSQYTSELLSCSDIFPKQKIENKPFLEYLFARTMMRPRDVIVFINTCLRYSEGKSNVSKATLLKAEGEYSKNRLRALADEWFGDYPDLIDFAHVLRKAPRSFVVRNFNNDLLDKYSLEQAINYSTGNKGITEIYYKWFLDSKSDIGEFKKILFGIFYKVGLVGIKKDALTEISWAYERLRPTISSSEINDDVRIYIHPFAWRILGTS